ncbi:MAG TPA: helix-turn-helix domain-containing protein [Solirubrobacteraceae bacterium]|jgi:AcrR family transcriptional regulator|nr:helix-turn-helix domain-containing protein [Solirubrobacteraceae bacterium]
MEVKHRTQEQRSAATRRALIDAARRLWAARGYAGVGTPQIAASAGVTRGAMYHQFQDKAALFLAVVEEVESDLTQRLAAGVAASAPEHPAAALHAAVDAWLAASQEPEVRQLVLLDAPVVLGWDGFRDVALRHGLGVTEALLQAAMDAGQLDPLPRRALAHIFIGALDEAAMAVATAPDQQAARAEVAEVLHALLAGLLKH